MENLHREDFHLSMISIASEIPPVDRCPITFYPGLEDYMLSILWPVYK